MKNEFKKCFGALLTGMLLTSSLVYAKKASPAQNYGFEAWKQDAYRLNPQSVKFSVDQDVKRDGADTVKIENVVDNDARLVQQVLVQGDRIYRVTAWVKTKSVKTSGDKGNKFHIGANICLFGSWIHSRDLKGTQEWTPLEFYVKTAPRQLTLPVACRVGYWGSTAKGTAWFDKVTVSPAVAPNGVDVPVFSQETEPRNNPSKRRKS